ncbi:hypothetical protein ColLi_09561 [Colletotrichum liriopes]|uniref:Uncharacterized protein n=1 Tax=Colletotrichum liriopes TaxID=708192 RepID=A0AA37GV87_9PEZI|nr:hypothetical protein ColLi_09561 [Colletotrichum liriopes]
MAARLVPTAERPLLGDTRLKMLEALEEDSLFEMSFFLRSEMMRCLEKDTNLPLHRTRQALAQDNANGSPMVKLLHAIPRKLTSSLVMGTLAYDYHPLQHNEKYPDDGAGAYAVAPYIEGRDGKFLNNKETQSLIDDLEFYIDAYHANARHQNNDQLMDVRDRRLQNFSNAVDKVSKDNWTPRDGVKLRWIQGKSTCNAIVAFREALVNRVKASPDATGDVYHEQAPIYVGCSDRMDGRLPHHSPKSTLSDTGMGLGLLLSILKYREISVDVVAIPVVWAWEDEMLPLSEVLVTLLAQSLADQGGLNVVEPGTQKDVRAAASAQTARRHEELEQYDAICDANEQLAQWQAYYSRM